MASMLCVVDGWCVFISEVNALALSLHSTHDCMKIVTCPSEHLDSWLSRVRHQCKWAVLHLTARDHGTI